MFSRRFKSLAAAAILRVNTPKNKVLAELCVAQEAFLRDTFRMENE